MPTTFCGSAVVRLYLGHVRGIDRLQQASKDVIDLGSCRPAFCLDFKQCLEAFVVQTNEFDQSFEGYSWTRNRTGSFAGS
jgi:hypothetical protein